jgi:RNA-directed DNA polymerase
VEYTYTPNVIRYADDFVVLHRDEAVVRECQELIAAWLRGMGLELKPSKTRIGHTLREVGGRAGFDFLGFTVRQFPAGASRSGCTTNGAKLGFKTLIKPRKDALRRHVVRLGEGLGRLRNAPQEAVIGYLNPIIRGWTNYYSTVVSSRAFSRMDNLLYQQLRSWARRRHPNKNGSRVAGKYWRVGQGLGWLFKPPGDSPALRRHTDAKIVRHAKVHGDRSPFDGNWTYWCGRMGRYPGVSCFVAFLLKRQAGTCNGCGLFFRPGDEIEMDHVRRRADGGTNTAVNLQLLHRHCHQRKAAEECRRGVIDPINQVAEEPDAGKLARPVLKTSRSGDTPA